MEHPDWEAAVAAIKQKGGKTRRGSFVFGSAASLSISYMVQIG
jgi:hypothetical protein